MIRRQIVTLAGGRQVHVQRAGEGPPVIVLHQSPCSSNDTLALVRRLSADFTVFAPDTPGNGLSDPIGIAMDAVSMNDFADNLAEVMTALGIPQAPVYGFHTGAMAAIAFSVRHPDRTPLVIANGYITMDPDGIDDIRRNYLVPFEPDWTGSHLTWWWARLRDQFIYFPFHQQTEATRSGMDIPPADFLQWNFEEFLLGGDGYRVPYYCAFSFDGQAAVAAARAPLRLMSDATDILYPFLDLVGPTSDTVTIHRAVDPADAEDMLAGFLKEVPALPAPPPIAASSPVPGKLRADFVQIDAGSVRVLRNEDGGGLPLVFLHDLGGSVDTVARFMKPWIGARPVLALDLPGGGETRIDSTPSLENQIAVLREVLAEIGLDRVEVIGFGTGATLAVALADEAPELVARIIAPRGFPATGNVEDLVADALPPVVPDMYGSHLHVVWTMLRHRALFTPWREGLAAKGIPGSPDVAAEIIHDEFVAWQKALPALPALARELFAYPVDKILAGIAAPVVVASQPLRGRVPDITGIEIRDLPLEPEPLAQTLGETTAA